MPIVSLIIPVYNVEVYLPKCIDSLLHQTFSDIEIILINDGSTDRSGNICDQYQSLDPRIQVVHQKNQGVSRARNTGLDQATGQYISFIDSDDWVSNDYIEILLNGINSQEDIDISFCEYYTVLNNRLILHNSSSSDTIYDNETGIYLLCMDKKIKNYVWGKLFKKELFSNIRFPEDRNMCEDMAILYKVFYQARRILHLKAPSYHYLVRKESSINSKWSPIKAYHHFLGGYEQSLFLRDKDILHDKRKKHECMILRRGIHLIHHLIKRKDYPQYKYMINDIIEKIKIYDDLHIYNTGIPCYCKKKMIHSAFDTYSRFYRWVSRI
ncbi:glycosyltransferase [Parabacteroides sp. GYB001]|uniref:glycosyltransferase family 2 protein n=1 Tax=Parabacteroides leei TaxID=2939491 RepID=UPI00201766C9|nr:glycosyltransferase [Parabacteroides leei]MCL3853354.1 glycosyltransferase [Parabacteroides leei]